MQEVIEINKEHVPVGPEGPAHPGRGHGQDTLARLGVRSIALWAGWQPELAKSGWVDDQVEQPLTSMQC